VKFPQKLKLTGKGQIHGKEDIVETPRKERFLPPGNPNL